uniref:Uncharacterized protein n=1 Tax=Chromera velia CCMP2878 TaxID=1169474 RepID=A0A0G4I0M0_9ALVE|eukprot:Cvel_1628.t1-p1 / transcript=Cvel_1628.t1 / gene=Cvel_1628 / organism=Chromera_velia_CCMP2878 / gene_product=hypothetical protein / transcript_product=hypothetical protein / location=Cvel_scaffold58:78128-78472(+) / protein_length=115 / sequence_SO=supercontig / SO=protein_coding / is_pseudo=false
MSETLSAICACHEKNAGIMARIQALPEVRTYTYSVRENMENGIFRPKVTEYVRKDPVGSFLEDWRFPGELDRDFPYFLSVINWDVTSWDDIKKLNEEVKKVAVSMEEWTRQLRNK